MTLREWESLNPKVPIEEYPCGYGDDPYYGGNLQVFSRDTALWHLDDYVVIAVVSGPSTIIRERRVNK